jgi:hypothetical protein
VQGYLSILNLDFGASRNLDPNPTVVFALVALEGHKRGYGAVSLDVNGYNYLCRGDSAAISCVDCTFAPPPSPPLARGFFVGRPQGIAARVKRSWSLAPRIGGVPLLLTAN